MLDSLVQSAVRVAFDTIGTDETNNHGTLRLAISVRVASGPIGQDVVHSFMRDVAEQKRDNDDRRGYVSENWSVQVYRKGNVVTSVLWVSD